MLTYLLQVKLALNYYSNRQGDRDSDWNRRSECKVRLRGLRSKRVLTTLATAIIRLLRAEVSDDKDDNNSDNIADNKNDDVLSDLITRVQKLEEAINNKSDNVVARTTDNNTDNIPIGLAFHEDDDNPDNREKSVPVDNKFDNVTYG